MLRLRPVLWSALAVFTLTMIGPGITSSAPVIIKPRPRVFIVQTRSLNLRVPVPYGIDPKLYRLGLKRTYPYANVRLFSVGGRTGVLVAGGPWRNVRAFPNVAQADAFARFLRANSNAARIILR